MSKFSCKCGVVIDLVVSPAKEEYLLLPESVVDDLAGKIDEDKSFSSDGFYQCIDEKMEKVIRCFDCGRIWIRASGGIYASYAREV